MTTTSALPTRLARAAALAALALAAACAPTVEKQQNPSSFVTAVFDPTAGEIPVPNDLLLQDPASLPAPAAQRELLTVFKNQRGFPNDQEVAVTFTFATTAGGSSTARTAPALDLASFGPATFFAFGITAAGAGEVPLDPIRPTDYAVVPDAHGSHGVLALHRKGRGPWAPGQYAVFVRGGAFGVRTAGGQPVEASPTFFLVAQGKDMTSPENVSALMTSAGSREAARALGAQLNQLIASYRPFYAVCDGRFPHEELAIMTTFAIAPAVTQVDLDPGRGLVPLPIDLLRFPGPGGKLTPVGACALAGGTLDATGTCRDGQGNVNGAAAGFANLDGFSTTAPILAPTNDLIDAATVTPATVQVYDLTVPTAPALVPAATLIHEPCEVTSSGYSPVVAVQPAGATSCDATSVFRTRPLKDATDYAVVISKGVKAKTGAALGRGTIGSVLLFENPLVDATGKSNLQGVDDPTAGALEIMRRKLVPVAGAAAAQGIAKDQVAMAYTFRTQTILSQAAGLGALPYEPGLPTPDATGPVTALTPADAFTKYGIDPTRAPSGHLAEVLETTIATRDLLDPATGAFRPNPADSTVISVHVLLAVPKTSAEPLRTPVVVYRHGIGRGRADMLAVADGFAARGFAVLAIDAAKHGDRSLCAKGDRTVLLEVGGVATPFPICADGAACVSPLPAGAQGDAKPPGICAAGYAKRPAMDSCIGNPACAGLSDGIPFVSAGFLISTNFFRSRDTFRQDIFDQSQLIRAVVVDPRSPPAGHTVFNRLFFTDGIVLDPLNVTYVSESLGSMQGAATVAANPRIRAAAFAVGGATTVDVFTTSPSFKGQVGDLLDSLGITQGTSGYLQFLSVAKTILDPADPANFAGHLQASTLPNLLPPLGGAVDGSVPQAAKQVLTQTAFCDQTVPNPWNFVFAANLGTGPLLGSPTFGAPGTAQLFFKGTSLPTPADFTACPSLGGGTVPASAVSHPMIRDWVDPVITGAVQASAADFLLTGNLQPSLVVLP